jgi:hypothetical protein
MNSQLILLTMKLWKSTRALVFLSVVCVMPTAFAEKILIIGDSLSANEPTGLGSQVFEKLKDEHQITAIGSCGSSPRWYLSVTKTISTPCGFLRKQSGQKPILAKKHATPKLESLTANDLDLAVIQQGTNLYGSLVGPDKQRPDMARSQIGNAVRSLLLELQKRAPSSACLWVAPPEIARYAGHPVTPEAKQLMFSAIQEALLSHEKTTGYRCDIYDSRKDTQPPGGDGTHFSSPKQTEKWIANVATEIRNLLAKRKGINPQNPPFLNEGPKSH